MNVLCIIPKIPVNSLKKKDSAQEVFVEINIKRPANIGKQATATEVKAVNLAIEIQSMNSWIIVKSVRIQLLIFTIVIFAGKVSVQNAL